MESKTCVVRGEGFRLKGTLKSYGFTFDLEAKVWYKAVEVNDQGVATFACETFKNAPMMLTEEGFRALLHSTLWKPKKIAVAFE